MRIPPVHWPHLEAQKWVDSGPLAADKIMRLHAQTATIENGFVHLPAEAHWLADYVSEMILFPAGRHDDQVDSTAQALAWAKRRPGRGECWTIIAGSAQGPREGGAFGGFESRAPLSPCSFPSALL